MQVQAFSCARPQPEHMERMHVPDSSAALDALIAEGAYTQDLGRCLYLVARRDGELVRRGIVCCGDVDELSEMASSKEKDPSAAANGVNCNGGPTEVLETEISSQESNTPQLDILSDEDASTKAAAVKSEEAVAGESEVANPSQEGNTPQVDGLLDENEMSATAVARSVLEQTRALGAHAEPIVCEYETSYALDVIVAAAQSATPLYNLSNGSDTQVVVWRVSREDAVQAICAVLATMDCAPTTESAAAIDAAKALADEAREKRPNLDARSAVLHPMCLLVPAGQDMGTPLLPSNGLLMHRFA